MKKNKKITLVLLGIIALPLFVYASIKPLNMLYAQAVTYSGATHIYSKATPEALNPDPENFRFENYTKLGKKALGTALACMFPVGTSKETIDEVLVENAGATYEVDHLPASFGKEREPVHRYLYPMPWGMVPGTIEKLLVSVRFENNRMLEGVYLGGLGLTKCKDE